MPYLTNISPFINKIFEVYNGTSPKNHLTAVQVVASLLVEPNNIRVIIPKYMATYQILANVTKEEDGVYEDTRDTNVIPEGEEDKYIDEKLEDPEGLAVLINKIPKNQKQNPYKLAQQKALLALYTIQLIIVRVGDI